MSILLALAVGAAIQAAPADADIACITSRLAPDVRARLLEEASTGVQGTIRQAFRDAAAECARERSWSAEHATALERLAAAQLVTDLAGERLRAAGIETAALDAWLVARPDRGANLDDAALIELLGQLVSRGVPQSRVEANANDIGLYLGARRLILQSPTVQGDR